MKLQTLSLLACIALISGCSSTYEGLKNDFSVLSDNMSSTWSTVSEKAGQAFRTEKEEQTQTIAANGCPPVILSSRLQTMTEFYNNQSTASDNIMSTVTLSAVKSRCVTQSDHLTMEIDLTFDSTLGPKARLRENDKPFFAYPYFIAVHDTNGTELARESFAVTMAYDEIEQHMTITETIKQTLPFMPDNSIPSYQIKTGLELTQEQMAYNDRLY